MDPEPAPQAETKAEQLPSQFAAQLSATDAGRPGPPGAPADPADAERQRRAAEPE